MKTFSQNKKTVERNWYVVDLEGKTLGRVATQIATYLRGKHKPTFSHNVDCGDYVIAVNAEKVATSGNKDMKKMYYSHSGYPGSLKTTSLKHIRQRKPETIITQAVSGMIPRTKLKKRLMAKFKVFVGPSHGHEAQKPQQLPL